MQQLTRGPVSDINAAVAELVTDEPCGAHPEFGGPFECCDCLKGFTRHEWGYPKGHPATGEGGE